MNNLSHINDETSYDCTAAFYINDLCVDHLANSITKLELPKGISVCFTDWDTNSNKEENNIDCVKIINFVKNTLFQIKENSLIDFEITDKGLGLTLKKGIAIYNSF